MATYGYIRPGVQVVVGGPQVPAAITTPQKVVGLISDFPQGPDFPTLISPADLPSVFGSQYASSSSGYRGPLAASLMNLQNQAAANTGFLYLVHRGGVVRAQAVVADVSSGTAFTIQAIGPYAGTRGANLAYTVTNTAGAITNLAIFDTSTGSPVLVAQWVAGRDLLGSNQQIASTVNAANPLTNPSSVVQIIGPFSPNPPSTVSVATNFNAGSPSDGKGVAANDASIPLLLNQGMYTYVDYLAPTFDAASIASVIQTHQASAIQANQWRKAYVGPQVGTSYSSLAGGYAAGIGSDRVNIWAHDAANTINPISGDTMQVDGYYLACAHAALKAVGPTRNTTTRASLTGFTNLAIAPGKTAQLTPGELDALAVSSTTGNGMVVVDTTTSPQGNLVIRHALTSAPYNLNSGINAFSEQNARDVDDAVSKMAAQVGQAFIGAVYDGRSLQQTNLLQSLNLGYQSLGNTISGTPTNAVTRDPGTGYPKVTSIYGMPVGTNVIQFITGFVLGQ